MHRRCKVENKSLHAVFFLVGLNLIWSLLSYLISQQSLEGVISSFRLFVTVILVYFFAQHVSRSKIVNFVVFIAIINATLVLLQVFEQYLSLDFLPPVLRYGFLYGFHESHDYEIFKKGGIFPSTQVSGLWALSAVILVNSYYKNKGILLLIAPSILFSGRSVIIFSIFYLLYLGYRTLSKMARSERVNFRDLTYFLLFCCAVFLYLDSEYSTHHLYRIKQAMNVFFSLDLSLHPSIAFFRYPADGMEFFFGNGLPRFHHMGGGDPLYSRWYLQSGFPSLFFIMAAVLVSAFVEYKTTRSPGLFTLLMLIHGFKDEVLTSSYFFFFYLLFLFSFDDVYDCKKRICSNTNYR